MSGRRELGSAASLLASARVTLTNPLARMIDSPFGPDHERDELAGERRVRGVRWDGHRVDDRLSRGRSRRSLDRHRGVGTGERQIGKVDLVRELEVAEVVLDRARAVDGEVVDLPGLQRGGEGGLHLRDERVGRVLQHRRRQPRVVVVGVSELQHLQDLIPGGVRRRRRPPDPHSWLREDLVPVARGQLTGSFAVARVSEGDLVRHEPHVPGGEALGSGPEHLRRDEGVVSDAEHVVGLLELGDVLHHVAARAELRVNRHVWVLFFERRDLVAERLRERAGTEDDERAARGGCARSRRAARRAVASDRSHSQKKGQQHETSL